MIKISHRVNTIKQLKATPKKFGIEIDIRDNNKKLIVTHDPFKKGVDLNKFLKFFKHRLIIANIKSERIENSVIKIFKKYKINNYFFLDSSFPKIIELIRLNFKKIAIRASYFEGIETSRKLKGKVNWVWYDTFKGLKSSINDIKKLKKLNFKICIVCPKLHNPKNSIDKRIVYKLKNNKLIDAVCTKEKFFKFWD